MATGVQQSQLRLQQQGALNESDAVALAHLNQQFPFER
jgi:hypothetical protein